MTGSAESSQEANMSGFVKHVTFLGVYERAEAGV
jgi:hypothetical protein